MSVPTILPQKSATAFMRALEQAEAIEPRVVAGVEQIRNIKGQRLAQFLPFLIYEYGLISLLPYVASQYTLLDEGRAWQIERGTYASIARALGWIESPGILREAPVIRRWWNSYQVALDNLPPNDGVGLDRIAEALRLSAPMRSDFRRGTHGYDVPMMVLDRHKLDGAALDTDSGISVKPNGPRWSFGTTTALSHELTEAEGEAIGNWLDYPEAETLRTWEDMDFPWTSANFTWGESAAQARRVVLAGWFSGRTVYARFRAAGGAVIGYRRCRAVRQVAEAIGGPYTALGKSYRPSAAGREVYFEAMTGFGDAISQSAEVALMVGAAPAASVKPGKQWLGPDELSGGHAIAVHNVSLELRATVRSRVKIMMRF